jgi:peptide/nickel transport system substrate-binding protein
MTDNSTNTRSSVNRRSLLKGLAATSSVSALAGCGSNGGNGNGGNGNGGNGNGGNGNGGDNDRDQPSAGEPGERVPTIVLEYWSDIYTSVFENSIPAIVSSWEELGLEVETVPVSLTTQAGNVYNDERTCNFAFWGHGLAPNRLDPNEWCTRPNLFYAGANGLSTPNNYANCDHTEAAHEQSIAPNLDARREIVNECIGQESEDIGSIPIFSVTRWGAYRNNDININATGEAGLLRVNSPALIKSSANSGTIQANVPPVTLESNIHMSVVDTSTISMWSNLFYSPVIGYNENYETYNILADNIETSNEGKTYTITLREATFHDGEPVTAEDVQWTVEFINNNYQEFPEAGEIPLDSSNVIDDSTIEFTMSTSYLPFLTQFLPRWGILPKHVWTEAGAEEDPAGFELEEVIGSGPYQVTDFRPGQVLQAEPHDGHPIFSPESNLTLRAFQDGQSAFSAFQDGQLNMFLESPAGIQQQIRDRMSEQATVVTTSGFFPYYLNPQMSFGPQMHREFRMATSQAIDREAANQTAMYGNAETLLYSTRFTPQHPWRPPEDQLTQIADSTGSNIETARSVLEEAGWSWDDEGRLRYPGDIDLTPRWPKGDEPLNYPDKFPCVENEELVNSFR